MHDDDQVTRGLIEAYLKASQPIHWVNWMARCADQESQNLLKSIMFENDGLRDLTDWHIREKVLETISESPPILALVIADLAEESKRCDDQRIS